MELELEPRAVGWGGALPHTPHPGLLPPAPGGQPLLTVFIRVHLLTVTVKRSDCPLESNSCLRGDGDVAALTDVRSPTALQN